MSDPVISRWQVNACPDLGENSPNLGDHAVYVLRAQFARWPLKMAAAEMGVPAETWKCWKDGRSRPNTDHLSRLFSRFGSGFRAAVLAPWENAGATVSGFRRQLSQPMEAHDGRVRRRA